MSESLDLVRVTVKCSACGYEEQHTVKTARSSRFRAEFSWETMPKMRRAIHDVDDKKDVIDDLAELAELSNTDVEIISTETEEGQMLKNAFGGIAAMLRFKQQAMLAPNCHNVHKSLRTITIFVVNLTSYFLLKLLFSG